MPYHNGINPALDASDFLISSMDSPNTELPMSSAQAGTCSPILVFWPDLISGFKSVDSVTTTPFTYDDSALKDDHLIPHLPSIASATHSQPPDFEPPTAGWRSELSIQQLAGGDFTTQEWKTETGISAAMWNETNVAHSHPLQFAPNPELMTLESASWDHDGGESIQHKRECSATTDSIPSWSRNCGRGESIVKLVQCLWNGCRHHLQLPKASEIKDHLRSHHSISLSASSSTRITCQWDHNGYMCGRKMYHRSLVKHIAITHLKADGGTCPACGEKFGRRDSLKRHTIAQHPFKSCGA
ncbi:hypothetical protein WOLCODRAFT_145495 [Wolfiporia cocos MD-104 SS10]|uniref:C2H2-type domain-containing protein n=1 Tax=Wolfiporia cocos (strain MD-104) TaxID=742152 RepID=A0A2H3JFK2_WOLCO|nr:hypothetical protein WOLCODRAFT_145495 [Wolfiporia cocos MD-104 SS10]